MIFAAIRFTSHGLLEYQDLFGCHCLHPGAVFIDCLAIVASRRWNLFFRVPLLCGEH